MRKISKIDEPTILKVNGATWTAQYCKLIAKKKAIKNKKQRALFKIPAKLRYAYREATIKAAIVDEAFKKCAYCEAKVTHIAYGDTEHIVPVSHDPNVIFQWDNLVLACPICNTEKGRKKNLVHPVNDDPHDHLLAAGATIMHKSLKGKRTHEEIKLNRECLHEDREDKIKGVIRNLKKSLPAASSIDTALFMQELNEELADNKEYTMVLRAAVRSELAAYQHLLALLNFP